MTFARSTSLRQFRPSAWGRVCNLFSALPVPPNISAKAASFPAACWLARYRIIALLGKGGMGEVYRADDLTLGQPVALKFLPDEAARDQALRERFKNEVRDCAARFSSQRLPRLRRGRLRRPHIFHHGVCGWRRFSFSAAPHRTPAPKTKALDIARQLCAGLAAAHAKGVLHRDLKPANIMPRWTRASSHHRLGLRDSPIRFRGPRCAAELQPTWRPEQLAGKEVSTRSDIYSLGLVLYEVFTGKRAFSQKPAEKLPTGGEKLLSRPSSLV